MKNTNNARTLTHCSPINRRTWIGLGLLATTMVSTSGITACNGQLERGPGKLDRGTDEDGCPFESDPAGGGCDKVTIHFVDRIEGTAEDIHGEYHRTHYEVGLDDDGEQINETVWVKGHYIIHYDENGRNGETGTEVGSGHGQYVLARFSHTPGQQLNTAADYDIIAYYNYENAMGQSAKPWAEDDDDDPKWLWAAGYDSYDPVLVPHVHCGSREETAHRQRLAACGDGYLSHSSHDGVVMIGDVNMREACDGASFMTADDGEEIECTDIRGDDGEQMFSGGQLGCDETCGLDFQNCVPLSTGCGDGQITGFEVCDIGANPDDPGDDVFKPSVPSCSDLTGGTMTGAVGCSQNCQGYDLTICEDANPTSCEGYCDGHNPVDDCFCDEECVNAGDCCDDYGDVCGAPGGTDPAPDSCDGYCDGHNPIGECWCDEACTGAGDCCDDYEAICSSDPDPPPPPPSTSNCCEPRGPGESGCDEQNCESPVCAHDSYCCDVEWDGVCADLANQLCAVCD